MTLKEYEKLHQENTYVDIGKKQRKRKHHSKSKGKKIEKANGEPKPRGIISQPDENPYLISGAGNLDINRKTDIQSLLQSSKQEPPPKV
jgi:hypothetical protein